MSDTTLRNMEAFLVHLDPTKRPRQYKVSVPRNGKMKDLCEALAKVANVDLDKTKLIVSDVYNHRFHKIYADEDSLMHILDRDDINIHEIRNQILEDSSRLIIPIYLREMKNSSFTLFGHPFFIDVPRECAYELLYKRLLRVMSRYVPSPNHDLGKNTFRPFNISIINSYGKTEIEGLTVNNGGDLLQLEAKNYLALDWYPASKLIYYNASEADEFTQDHSTLCKEVTKADCSQCNSNYTNEGITTTQNIKEDLEGMVKEIIQKIITKIDDLNSDLGQINVPEIKRLNERFYKIIDDLKMSKDSELQKIMAAKEKEIQILEEKYTKLEKNIEEENVKKDKHERKRYQDEMKSLEDNSKAIKDEITKSIDTLTDILHKLENPSDLDTNIKKDMECPVCFNEMKPPTRIFQCSSGHLICNCCKENMGRTKCPTCKEANIMGRAIAIEQLARTLYGQQMQED